MSNDHEKTHAVLRDFYCRRTGFCSSRTQSLRRPRRLSRCSKVDLRPTGVLLTGLPTADLDGRAEIARDPQLTELPARSFWRAFSCLMSAQADSGAPRKARGAFWPLAGVTPLASRNNASRVTPGVHGGPLPYVRDTPKHGGLLLAFGHGRDPGSRIPAASRC